MIRLCAGRPLIWKMRSTAEVSKALAARPYTVSVGSATTSPARSSSAARRTAASKSGSVWVGRTCAFLFIAQRLDRVGLGGFAGGGKSAKYADGRAANKREKAPLGRHQGRPVFEEGERPRAADAQRDAEQTAR